MSEQPVQLNDRVLDVGRASTPPPNPTSPREGAASEQCHGLEVSHVVDTHVFFFVA